MQGICRQSKQAHARARPRAQRERSGAVLPKALLKVSFLLDISYLSRGVWGQRTDVMDSQDGKPIPKPSYCSGSAGKLHRLRRAMVTTL